LWGAYVRASGSGAGCGQHWPLCNGEVVPRAPAAATLIELTHRATSGVALLLVVGLAVAAYRVTPARGRVRRAAFAALGLMIVEALLGAGLVLFRLVAEDTSMMRGYSMALHLTNTLLLLGALALTAAFASGLPSPRLRGNGAVLFVTVPALVGVLALGTTGAVAALGDTLFPVKTLAEGLAQDLSPQAHAFLRLRAVHPLLAVLVAGWLVLLAPTVRAMRATPLVHGLARALSVAVVGQMALGLLDITLLAPTALQLAHLLGADVVWLLVVLLSASALAAPAAAPNAAAVATPLA